MIQGSRSHIGVTILVILALCAIFATAANPWQIDETKYTIPPKRNETWSLTRDEFDNCGFGYGVSYTSYYQKYWQNTQGATFTFDYIAIWLGDKEPTWNKWWIEQALLVALHYNKPFQIFAYVIAESAKENLDIEDCDVHPTNNLCYKGADWIRSSWESNIIPQYKNAAENIQRLILEHNAANPAKPYTRSILWAIEPDFQQYHDFEDSTQENGPIVASVLAGKYYMEIVSTISKYQTAAPNRFFTDISPWLNERFQPWMEKYPSDYVDGFYGGLNSGSDLVKVHWYNDVTYSQVNQLYGGNTRPIFAQGGWGVNGGNTDTYLQWLDGAKVSQRMPNNVLAATFSNDDLSIIVAAMENASTGSNSQTQCYWNGIKPAGGNGEATDTDGGNKEELDDDVLCVKTEDCPAKHKCNAEGKCESSNANTFTTTLVAFVIVMIIAAF